MEMLLTSIVAALPSIAAGYAPIAEIEST